MLITEIRDEEDAIKWIISHYDLEHDDGTVQQKVMRMCVEALSDELSYKTGLPFPVRYDWRYWVERFKEASR